MLGNAFNSLEFFDTKTIFNFKIIFISSYL